MQFDYNNIIATEFGFGRDAENNQTYVVVPVDASVQAALKEMLTKTWSAMKGEVMKPTKYCPAEKHSAIEYLYLPIDDAMGTAIRNLHFAAALETDVAALNNIGSLFCYFARFTDANNRRLTAVRRASLFKGVLKSKNRLIRLIDDTLKIVDESIFRLDNDFDLLADNENIFILRPSGFEYTGQLQQAILNAVPDNIKLISSDIKFIDFANIESYASTHPRAARCVAAIKGSSHSKDIDKDAFLTLCKANSVEVGELNGKLTVSSTQAFGVLDILNRRRYRVELVKGQPELYKAGSRTKLGG